MKLSINNTELEISRYKEGVCKIYRLDVTLGVGGIPEYKISKFISGNTRRDITSDKVQFVVDRALEGERALGLLDKGYKIIAVSVYEEQPVWTTP